MCSYPRRSHGRRRGKVCREKSAESIVVGPVADEGSNLLEFGTRPTKSHGTEKKKYLSAIAPLKNLRKRYLIVASKSPLLKLSHKIGIVQYGGWCERTVWK